MIGKIMIDHWKEIETALDKYKVSEKDKEKILDAYKAICWECKTIDDVVKVVRCKDCKYGRFNEKGGLFCDWHYMYNPFGYGQEGYCLYGERSDDDETD